MILTRSGLRCRRAEVHQMDTARPVEQQIRGLDVEVNHQALMTCPLDALRRCGRRLLHTAECTAHPVRAAALAREALDAYGPQLPADSPRRQRLDALIAGASR